MQSGNEKHEKSQKMNKEKTTEPFTCDSTTSLDKNNILNVNELKNMNICVENAISYTRVREKLTAIPVEDLKKLHNLKKLILHTNSIKNMDGFAHCKKLITLDLSDNLIQKIEHIENCIYLKSLDLGYNLLTETDGLLSLNKLEHLYLMSNDITHISPLPTSLITLDIACNDLEEIANLSDLINLKELYLGNNSISYIKHGQINQLMHCHTLSLQANKLIEIDCELLPLNLKYLFLSENKELIKIKNLNYLKHLEYLDLWRTQLSDVQGIDGCEIVY